MTGPHLQPCVRKLAKDSYLIKSLCWAEEGNIKPAGHTGTARPDQTFGLKIQQIIQLIFKLIIMYDLSITLNFQEAFDKIKIPSLL